ncbi:thiopeptide-type bacteriocin [Bradyrhizobium semiaridum]|uniref:thiopeptide-type bacteriocin n=1 Tax=Bradyrhizobium semiaridum TaxID=2821404 RepID=UPI0035DD0A60
MIKSHVLYRLSYALTHLNYASGMPEVGASSGSCSSPRCVGGGAHRVNSRRAAIACRYRPDLP